MNALTGAIVVFATTCTNHTLRSELDQFDVDLDDLDVTVHERADPAWPILVGSTFRIDVRDQACVRPRVFGPVDMAVGTVRPREPGTVRIELDTRACDPVDGLTDDGLTLNAIAPSEATPLFVRPVELEGIRRIDEGLADPVGDLAAMRPHVLHTPGEPIQVLEGESVQLALALSHGDGWAFTSDTATQAYLYGHGFERKSAGALKVGVTVSPGAVGTLGLATAEAHIDIAEVRAVPALDAASLDIVGFVQPSPLGPELGLTAVVRDGEGRRIDGAPISWELDPVEVGAQTSFAGGAIGGVIGFCVPNHARRQPFSWSAIARFGALEDVIEGEVSLPRLALSGRDQRDLRRQRRAVCPGCGCNAAPAPASLGALAGLAALLWRRRRPRAGRT